jgi:hypothetical protein
MVNVKRWKIDVSGKKVPFRVDLDHIVGHVGSSRTDKLFADIVGSYVEHDLRNRLVAESSYKKLFSRASRVVVVVYDRDGGISDPDPFIYEMMIQIGGKVEERRVYATSLPGRSVANGGTYSQ